MRIAILTATAIALSLVVPSALALYIPPVINWSDDFQTHTIGNALHDHGFPWAPGGNINSYTIQNDGTGNLVVQTANSGGSLAYEWCEHIVKQGDPGVNVQWLHFMARSSGTATDTRFRDSVALTASGGNEIARFQFNASQFKSRITPVVNHNGPATNYNDGLWHDFDIKYDITVGTIEFYYDGGLYQSVATGETRPIDNVELWAQSWSGGPGWQYDNLVVGTVPEPAMMLLLLGAVPMLLRRRR